MGRKRGWKEPKWGRKEGPGCPEGAGQSPGGLIVQAAQMRRWLAAAGRLKLEELQSEHGHGFGFGCGRWIWASRRGRSGK